MEFNTAVKAELLEKLSAQFPDAEFTTEEFAGEISLIFHKKHIAAVAAFLKDDPSFQFLICEDITAIDWATRKHRFMMVYILYSMKLSERIKLKCTVEEDDQTIDSVASVWKSANWSERETYDMYGITFNNHPDHRRMYMPEEFEYHPLRKDYPLMGIPGDLPLPKKSE